MSFDRETVLPPGAAPPRLPFPTWPKLRESVLEACRHEPDVQPFLEYLDGGDRALRRAALDAACGIGRLLPASSETRALCEGPRDDLILFLLHQLHHNAPGKADGEPSGDLLFRPHHQLPCTRATLQRRVSHVQRYVAWDEPILIIGDDDMQGVALARAGYADITVVEIDPRIADAISRAAGELPGSIRVVREDITGIGRDLARPFRATLIDPPCHVPGFTAFLDGVVRLNAGGAGSLLFLNTSLLSYRETGYTQVTAALERYGFSPLDVSLGFNRYAVPRLPRLALNALLRALEPGSSVVVRSFVSDLMLMRRK